MSTKYSGGFITKSPVAPTSSAASGIWTLDQQQQAQKAGTWPSPPVFIEDLFSTFLYTGTGAAQTITNGIDLAGKGGMTWAKSRSTTAANLIFDTVRGYTNTNAPYLITNNTDSEFASANTMNATSSGFDITVAGGSALNANGTTYCSWTFREQAKFFDIVTWSGNGTTQTISHNLGSTPGCVMVKCISAAGTDWFVWHRATTSGYYLRLNATSAQSNANAEFGFGNNTITVDPTSTVFTVGNNTDFNGSGRTYVAYLFAHDAGGFPVSGGGSTNGITCGSVTSDSSGNASVNLGYEPQWVLLKNTTGAQYWYIVDNMRGLFAKDKLGNGLFPNGSSGETADLGTSPWINSTGMEWNGSYNPLAASSTYIYIAIRRGPMKTPTVGTSVFAPVTATAPASPYTVTTNFPVDLSINSLRNTSAGKSFNDRLRGGSTTSFVGLNSTSTAVENIASGYGLGFQSNTSIIDKDWQSGTGANPIYWNFKRAPGFFDEVCYTGTGSTRTVTHNLGVVPELMIVKARNDARDWLVYSSGLTTNYFIKLNTTAAQSNSNYAYIFGNDTVGVAPTSSVFTVGSGTDTNGSGNTYVAYLFASCAGVSKVGSYTGNGTTQTIDCGFTGGARFVLIKQTNSSGSWFTYDTARGMTVLTDPYLRLNNTAAEVATLGSVTTVSTGFALDSNILPDINFNADTYIFLAIA